MLTESEETDIISPEHALCLDSLLQKAIMLSQADGTGAGSAAAQVIYAPLASADVSSWTTAASTDSSPTAPLQTAAAPNDSDSDEDEATFDEPLPSAMRAPDIAVRYSNSCRGNSAYKKNSIGIEGLKVHHCYSWLLPCLHSLIIPL